MQIFKTTKDMQTFIQNYKIKNPTHKIGLVPTMGALHNGHLSLIRQSVESCELTIVSIFVNPTQFGKNEDFNKYPRKEEADINLCKSLNAVVFMPTIDEMYPYKDDMQIKLKAPQSLSNTLEGKARAGHFDGVVQVVLKLFNIVTPHRAFFGKKDAQQLLIIKQMIEDLFLPIEIVESQIIRDENGLALSSRNAYLNDDEKNEALKISKSLREASKAIINGETNSKKIKEIATKVLEGLEIEYFEIVNKKLETIKTIEKNNTIILIVVRINGVRLLDNLWL
ncbi:pantoate--beta-alanine ligase [Helicobacter sp. WB40]|uniref:pantoate--beta-alanine ligase n=1 Tax=Helicobacter sp. WB40 TaxID=3004130 RepID=UPI0022EBB9C3|nr:pantoate--beta-alanine ligase [Helicobacter sp. WB40]MDA3967981.1 pantoate--beta-alanine ligase [Helicobacter sp. WB40]